MHVTIEPVQNGWIVSYRKVVGNSVSKIENKLIFNDFDVMVAWLRENIGK